MRVDTGLILTIVLTLLCGEAVLAYRPGPDVIRECPKCKTLLEQSTMASGNTLGARFWTDGKTVAPMRPDRPWLVKCPKCGGLIWLDEARQLGERRNGEKEKWSDAIKPQLPTEADYLTLLSGAKQPETKELYLRRRAWWAGNDAIRANEDASINLSSKQKANMKALAELMDEEDADQRITKAELMRELKRFDACLALLTDPFENKHHAAVASFIKSLAIRKSWTVKEIKGDKEPNTAMQPAQGPAPGAASFVPQD